MLVRTVPATFHITKECFVLDFAVRPFVDCSNLSSSGRVLRTQKRSDVDYAKTSA